jgi:hypothetical protein
MECSCLIFKGEKERGRIKLKGGKKCNCIIFKEEWRIRVGKFPLEKGVRGIPKYIVECYFGDKVAFPNTS